jgi:hypothetical protein
MTKKGAQAPFLFGEKNGKIDVYVNVKQNMPRDTPGCDPRVAVAFLFADNSALPGDAP